MLSGNAPPKEPNPIEEDLLRLEIGIRQLKVQYERYFAGARKREPIQLRGQLNKIIRRYADEPLRKYQHRFQYNSLVARFNVMAEHWGRRLRKLEREGPTRRAAPQAPAPAADASTLVARCQLGAPAAENNPIRDLHAGYIKACSSVGNEKGQKISFERFAKSVSAKTELLQKKSGCAEIEMRVEVREGRVELRARPIREGG